jgi:hypothetical protein
MIGEHQVKAMHCFNYRVAAASFDLDYSALRDVESLSKLTDEELVNNYLFETISILDFSPKASQQIDFLEIRGTENVSPTAPSSSSPISSRVVTGPTFVTQVFVEDLITMLPYYSTTAYHNRAMDSMNNFGRLASDYFIFTVSSGNQRFTSSHDSFSLQPAGKPGFGHQPSSIYHMYMFD